MSDQFGRNHPYSREEIVAVLRAAGFMVAATAASHVLNVYERGFAVLPLAPATWILRRQSKWAMEAVAALAWLEVRRNRAFLEKARRHPNWIESPDLSMIPPDVWK